MTRDEKIVRLVFRFKQLSALQIHDILFHGLSYKPCNRALNRLVAAELLRRVELRLVGGDHGGSGQYVYSLGRRGHFDYYKGRYEPARTIKYHELAVGDCYRALAVAHHEGRLQLVSASVGPTERVGNLVFRPDLRVEVILPSGERRRVSLEMDMATEGERYIRAKLETYWRAWKDWAEPTFPWPLWVAVDKEREVELRLIIGRLPEEQRKLFGLTTRDELVKVMHRNIEL